MFDVGFSEMLMIALVALVVIGPERLPKVARTLGYLLGRLQRYVNEVKADINREIELDELRKFKSEFENAARSAESAVRAEMTSAEAQINSVAAGLSRSVDEAAQTPAAVPPPTEEQPDLFAERPNDEPKAAASEPASRESRTPAA